MPLDWVSKEEHVYTWAASAMSQAEEILGPLGLPVNCSVKSITIRVRERERSAGTVQSVQFASVHGLIPADLEPGDEADALRTVIQPEPLSPNFTRTMGARANLKLEVI